MRNIYFVQACDTHGSGKNASAYLPYATGLLAAYAFRNPIISQQYQVKRFIYKKERIADAIQSMKSPAVVGFSTYLWNEEYNKAFAAALKAQFPSCVIIFGGHNVRNADASQLETESYIDFLIHGEGEAAFAALLEHLCTDNDFSDIPNISYRKPNGIVVTTKKAPICEIDYPSPYLEGWFDDILKNDPIEFSALLETNRGCPFHCQYCDWGSIDQRIRQFPIERVIAEMRFFAEHKIRFCFCIDSNFGMFPRDYEIVDAFLKIKEETGYPEMFKCCTTEGSGTAEFQINKKLNDCHILKGASLALQTLSDEALKNINRQNMSIHRYGKLSALYNEANIPTYSELIYGLPGETYESFSNNLGFMLESGTTRGCFIHYCELLPNAALAKPENMEKYKIRTARIPYTQFHSPVEREVEEYSNIIVSTYSMDYDAWIRTCVFGLFVQCFHYMGILQCISKFSFYETHLPYKDFFERLIAWASSHPDTVLGKYYFEMVRCLSALKTGGTIRRAYYNPKFGEIDWPLEEGLCLEILTNADLFYKEIRSFLFELLPQSAVTEALLQYQYMLLRLPGETEKEAVFDYDFHSYFDEIDLGKYHSLEKRHVRLIYKNKKQTDSLPQYAQHIVWFGRKSASCMYAPWEITEKPEEKR